ncbi:MAG: formate/nitrite transporter family protein [Syntrophomonadaceae bacterium]|nr:formate/nitrite transporter family protein [Syntrophomonadaceae bacterium]
MNFMTPAEIAVAVSNAGKGKTELPFIKMFVMGILAGAYIGFGANLATKVGAAPDANTSIGIVLFGAVFSVGLMMVVIGGSELFTGNNMFCLVSTVDGQNGVGGLLYNWVVVFIANFVGSLLLMLIIFYGNFWFSGGELTAHGIKAMGIAKAKMSLTFGEAFCRGICCNWLVCMAVWLALAAKDVVGKIFGIFFPIMAFVASGFEHSVANMFFIPMGISIANAAPADLVAAASSIPAEAIGQFFSYGNFMLSNLLPVTLGNIVGGGIFVGCFYWFIYLRGRSKA